MNIKINIRTATALAVACSALLCAGFEAGKASVDWGKPEWKGGYITMPATETNMTLQIGMRDDGVVVWRKVK